jgi:uncharacterized membrane protein YbhN (UPF0104 family)
MLKAAKRYIFISKLLIVIFALFYIGKKIYQNEEYFFGNIRQAFQQTNNIIYFIICFALVFINWGLEAYKWQKSIAKIEKFSFFSSLKAVLSGITTSIFTPNRIGEFGGRMIYLDEKDWIKAALISILCGIAQLLVTIVLGTLGFLFFFPTYFEINTYLYLLTAFIFSTLIVLLLFMFLNISVLEDIVEKFNVYLAEKIKLKWFEKINKYIIVFSYYNLSELSGLLMISLIRYLVFSIQFWIMLKVFGVELDFLPGIVLISVVFFCMTIIPTFALTEVSVRTTVAVVVIGSYYLQQNFPELSIDDIDSVNPEFSPAVIAASLSLWLINLAFPALAGSFFIFRSRFKNSTI